MEINSHPLSNSRQVAPIFGGKSLHGVIADLMGSPIPAVVNGSPSGLAFKSDKGLGSVNADYSNNPVSSIISPFKNLPNNISYRTNEVQPIIDQFLNRIERYAESNRIPSSTLKEAHDSANQLIQLNIDSLALNWNSLLSKYTAIVNEALNSKYDELVGVNDKPIPLIAGDLRFKYAKTGSGDALLDLSDAREMIDGNVQKIEISRQFALTEFLMTTGICSVVDLNCAGNVLNNVKVSSSKRGAIVCDQHDVGSVTSVIATTHFYRGLLAAMTELVKVLKDKRVFNKTIIHISSEFNRSPRADGAGSDHGIKGGSASLISGMFNEVAFIGNILKDGTPSNPGTWGVAADWEFENGDKRPIHVNDIARSITAMTGAKDIVSNGYPLVQPSGNGFWVPKKAGGKNV